jgi:hypothetical protein
MRGRLVARYAVSAQVVLLLVALVGPAIAAAATTDFTLSSPSVSIVNYSDLVTLRGTYTCVNGGADPSDCPTTSLTQVATFAIRPSGGSTFTTAATVSSTFVFTTSSSGCPTTCSVPFQVTWKAGRAGSTSVPPGVYDIGLTTTISPGQLVLTSGLTITQEGTTTTYTGAVSGLGGNPMALGASVVDLDRGLSPGTSIISPDINLGGAAMVTFALYDSTNTTLVVGPVSATLTSGGLTSGSPSLTPPSSGGSFRMRTTYVGNGYYTTSSDLDSITVTPTNTAPTLTVPAGPIVEEATSPAGATVSYSVSATDLEDDPDPTPACDHQSGDTFPVGETTVSCSVTDSGGLADSDSFVVSVVDSTDPSVGVSTGESSAGNGWYNAASNDSDPGVTLNVVVGDLVGLATLTCTDNGVDVGALDASGASLVVFDGHHVVDCLTTDAAGNDASAGATLDVDQTAPTISATVSPTASGTGWWNATTGVPTVTFSCADGTSGVAICSDPAVVGEGVDQTVSGTATDAAGNTATTSVTGLDVDVTGPGPIAFVGGGLADGGQYPYLYVPAGPTGCTAADGGSGFAACELTAYSPVVGTHVITALATDVAGNATSATLTYDVLAWTLVGFARPVEMTAINTIKAGGSIPLKFQVFAGAIELDVSEVTAAFEQQQFDCVSGALVGAAAPVARGSRAKPTSGQTSTKWDAPNLPGTCWYVTVRTIDGSSLTAAFKLR